jgi:CHAD domain-containing protein
MGNEQSKVGGSLGAHLRTLLGKRLQKLESSLKFSAAGDPIEAVHDLRVASRRLRAFGVVFREQIGTKVQARLEKKLKRVTQSAGSTRDWDVQMGLLEGRIERAASDFERACLEHLLEHFDAERSTAATNAEKRLRKLDVTSLSSALASALDDALGSLRSPEMQRSQAREVLLRIIGKASETLQADEGIEHAEQLHRLRINVKELRYALELFEPVLGPHYGVLYERATNIQELLGTHHDLVVLGELVAARAAALEQKKRRSLSTGLKAVTQTLVLEQEQILARFHADGFDPDWWRQSVESALEVDSLERPAAP